MSESFALLKDKLPEESNRISMLKPRFFGWRVRMTSLYSQHVLGNNMKISPSGRNDNRRELLFHKTL